MFKALRVFYVLKLTMIELLLNVSKIKGETMSYNIEALQLKVAQLSRKTHELGIPVMILFEGVPASGKTRLSNELLLNLDAKYTDFIATKSPEAHNLRYQFLQKYWNTLPQKGNINIYFRSWYSHYLDYKENQIKQNQYSNYDVLIRQIDDFENMLKKIITKSLNFSSKSMKKSVKNILNKQKKIH